MLSVKEVASLIGRQAELIISRKLKIEITILDVRESFGNLQWLVTPVAGSGEEWKDAGSMRLVEEPVIVGSTKTYPESNIQ